MRKRKTKPSLISLFLMSHCSAVALEGGGAGFRALWDLSLSPVALALDDASQLHSSAGGFCQGALLLHVNKADATREMEAA